MEIFLKRLKIQRLLSVGAATVAGLMVSGCLSSPENYAGYRIYKEFRQPASANVEEAVITDMACWSNDKRYFIYKYPLRSPVQYRAIKPKNWSTPIGGRDHPTFLAAVAAACGTTEAALLNGTY